MMPRVGFAKVFIFVIVALDGVGDSNSDVKCCADDFAVPG
jgi:hypothetical protein